MERRNFSNFFAWRQMTTTTTTTTNTVICQTIIYTYIYIYIWKNKAESVSGRVRKTEGEINVCKWGLINGGGFEKHLPTYVDSPRTAATRPQRGHNTNSCTHIICNNNNNTNIHALHPWPPNSRKGQYIKLNATGCYAACL